MALPTRSVQPAQEAPKKKYFTTPQSQEDVVRSIAILQGVELLLKYLPCNNWANHPDVVDLRARAITTRAVLEEELPKKR